MDPWNSNESNTINTIDIIIPAFEDSKNLDLTVRKTISTLTERVEFHFRLILVVNINDPSNTPSKAEILSRNHSSIITITLSSPPSFDKALKAGLKESSGNATVIMMSDLSDSPKFIPKFINKLEEGYDVVHGSRFLDESSISGYGIVPKILNRTFNLTAKNFFDLNTVDLSNAFKAYRTSVIHHIGVENLKSSGFSISVEIALRAHLSGFSHTEIPVDWKKRVEGESRFSYLKEGFRSCSTLLFLFLKNYLMNNLKLPSL
jgi:glycosyltransferase involved in cell wall biosynthesis